MASDASRAKFAPAVVMPDDWNGRLESLLIPGGLSIEKVQVVSEILNQWRDSDEPSSYPVACLVFQVLAQQS
jgi:hypothetical protein